MTASKVDSNHSDSRITVTANRGGDTFSFSGIVTGITESGIAATVLGNLPVDELVSLRYMTKSLKAVETRARIRCVQTDQYHFDLLPSDGDAQRFMDAPDEVGTKMLGDCDRTEVLYQVEC